MASYKEITQMLAAIVRNIKSGVRLAPTGALIDSAEKLVVEAQKGINRPLPWTPFVRSEVVPLSGATLQAMSRATGYAVAEIKAVAEEAADRETWTNSRYQVQILRDYQPIWISIKRLDQSDIHIWRDLQRIKTELLGPDWEALELYPAENRLVDMANQYHLWAFPGRIPFGFDEGRHLIQPDFDAPFGQSEQEEVIPAGDPL